MDLHKKHCATIEGGTVPLSGEAVEKLRRELRPGWLAGEDTKLTRLFEFRDFRQAIKFVNQVADLAERESHHPDIGIFYNKVNIELWTHSASGLTENDFILAAKIDRI